MPRRRSGCGLLALVARAQPGRDGWLVFANLFGLEVEGDLTLGGFGSVGGVNQVHLANGASRSLQTAGGAEEVADDANDFQALEDAGDNRAASDELFQLRIPAFFHVF